jgi:hypothetical protein
VFVNFTVVMMQGFISDDCLIQGCEAWKHKNLVNVSIGLLMKIDGMKQSEFMFW